MIFVRVRRLSAYFYSRPCGRGDGGRKTSFSAFRYFYSRPCGRGDFCSSEMLPAMSFISTHAPAGGATPEFCVTPPSCAHFYSRPCGRGDQVYRRGRISGTISTHAPAGGATGDDDAQHWRYLFLLTPLREGRRGQLFRRRISMISTHAPAGGATRSRATSGSPRKHFYSRPCGRGDLLASLLFA